MDCRPERKKMWNQEINNRQKKQGKVKGMKIY